MRFHPSFANIFCTLDFLNLSLFFCFSNPENRAQCGLAKKKKKKKDNIVIGEWLTLPLHHSLPVLGNIEYLGVERRQVHLVPVVTVPAQLVAELGAEQPQLRQLEQHVGEHGRLGRVVARHLQLDGLDQLVLDCLDAALVRQPDSL